MLYGPETWSGDTSRLAVFAPSMTVATQRPNRPPPVASPEVSSDHKITLLVESSRKTVEMLKGHQFVVIYKETDGAHTWDKGREYLNEFAPHLFRRVETTPVPARPPGGGHEPELPCGVRGGHRESMGKRPRRPRIPGTSISVQKGS